MGRCLPLLVLFACLSFIVTLSRAQSTCSASSPCKVGCCSKFGSCGFGPDFCGSGNCTGSCGAKSECDAGWGAQWSQAEKCPLNVCCSKFGFCGTTPDFCGSSTVPEPSCGGASSNGRTIGYYEGWNTQRSCGVMFPEQIPIDAYTHINFAFAYINPTSFAIAPMDASQPELYGRVTSLKQMKPGLQAWISVGGWSMNDPDQPTHSTFSQLAASAASQQAFFTSLISFMQTYGFDGVDLDWEYPVAAERSGQTADFANFVTFLQNLRAALSSSGHNYGLSITIPSSYWYMRHFDIINLAKTIDWFNIMTYDLHGTWDSTDPFIGAIVQSHTNLTEIDQALQLLWRNNINPSQVNLGLGFYGRSFTLSNPGCTAPGCPFSGGAKPGPCTNNAGTLSLPEINDIVKNQGASVRMDPAAAAMIAVWGGNQWVSYDNQQTLAMKVDFANKHCLGGTFVWAVDLDNKNGTYSGLLSNSTGQSARSLNSTQPSPTNLDQCYTTACGASCMPGTSTVQTMAGGRSGSGFGSACAAGSVKRYCCPTNNMPTCRWAGAGPICSGQCSNTEVALTTDTGGCWVGQKTLCCSPSSINEQASNKYTVGSGPNCGSSSCGGGDTQIASGTDFMGQEPCYSGSKVRCKRVVSSTGRSSGEHCVTTEASFVTNQLGGPYMCPLVARKCPAGKVLDSSLTKGCFAGAQAVCCDPELLGGRSLLQFQTDISDYLSSNGYCPVNPIGTMTKRDAPGLNKELESASALSDANSTNSIEKRHLVGKADYATFFSEITIAAQGKTSLALKYQQAWDDKVGPVTNVHMHDFNSFYSHFPDDEPIQYTQDLVCEWKDAIVQIVTFPGNQVELCLSPAAVTGPGSKRRDVSIVRRKPVFHLDNDHTAAPELNSDGPESFFEDPSTGYAMQQIIGGNVPVLYTRLINFRPGDTIIEVVFDVRRGNLYGADPTNIYMVFHFHVYSVLDVIGSNGRFIGIGSFNVFHARGVYFNPATGDYRANGWNAQNNQRNARREVFNCDTDSAGQELWYPGYITETAGQTTAANLRIEQFGNVLYRAGILAEGVLTNTLQDFNVYDGRNLEWAWPEGFNESPSFRIQGGGPGQTVDLAGEPSDLDGIPQGLQGDPTQDEH